MYSTTNTIAALMALAAEGKLTAEQFVELPPEVQQLLIPILIKGAPSSLPLEPELRDLSHVYGAGSFGEQFKQTMRRDSVGIVSFLIWFVGATILVAVGFWIFCYLLVFLGPH